KTFAEAGGTVWFLADSAWSELTTLSSLQAWFPFRLRALMTRPVENGFSIQTPPSSSPLHPLAKEWPSHLGRVRIHEFMAVEARTADRPLLTMSNDLPLLVQTQSGKGSYYFWTAALNSQDNSLALNAGFPALLRQSLQLMDLDQRPPTRFERIVVGHSM